jgi:hypothetical protein
VAILAASTVPRGLPSGVALRASIPQPGPAARQNLSRRGLVQTVALDEVEPAFPTNKSGNRVTPCNLVTRQDGAVAVSQYPASAYPRTVSTCCLLLFTWSLSNLVTLKRFNLSRTIRLRPRRG